MRYGSIAAKQATLFCLSRFNYILTCVPGVSNAEAEKAPAMGTSARLTHVSTTHTNSLTKNCTVVVLRIA
jgi:hypothetical protein